MVCYIGAMKTELFALHADIEERHRWFVEQVPDDFAVFSAQRQSPLTCTTHSRD